MSTCLPMENVFQTRNVHRCDMTTATSEHPFGYPRHVSTNIHDCVHTFDFPTVLVCKDVFETEPVSEPDSCIIYHSGIKDYINITGLMQETPYIVKVKTINGLTGDSLTNTFFRIRQGWEELTSSRFSLAGGLCPAARAPSATCPTPWRSPRPSAT